jgi:ribosomal protein S12 methylthiotransferase
MKRNVLVCMISLGCPKNLVDSETMLGHLASCGYAVTPSPAHADAVIINTCSFIHPAREESYEIIARTGRQLSPEQKLIVCGCLPQLQGQALFTKFPRIDALLGSADYFQIEHVLDSLLKGNRHLFHVNTPSFLADSTWPRLISTAPGYAYIKLSEGCANHCSYCLIPQLRGAYRSRPLEDVIAEAKNLAGMGIKELILVAQDTSFYGWDKGDRTRLLALLRGLERIAGIAWIRMLYAHPAHIHRDLLLHMASSHKFLSYLDIPLQHTHDDILSSMNRPPFETARRVIEEARVIVPGLVLRTTMLVGFPGETRHHFRKLVHDVEQLAFDWLGVFAYSPEPGTPSSAYEHQVPQSIRNERRTVLFELQKDITNRVNRKRIGQVYSVLIERRESEHEARVSGHTWFQTPEIDGSTYLSAQSRIGEMVPCVVTKVQDDFDLLAQELHERTE